MSAMSSYSLWVMPAKGPLADKLQGEIKQLAAQVPGAPLFQPHVTLLGGICSTEGDMLATARRLAQRLKPYRVTFDRVATGPIFHQCVYVLCQTEAATMQAGAAAREAYGQDPSSSYMPHLSLLYSDVAQAERDRVAHEAQQRLLGGPDALLQGDERGFDVGSLTVWETEESDRTLQSWRQLAEFPLEG